MRIRAWRRRPSCPAMFSPLFRHVLNAAATNGLMTCNKYTAKSLINSSNQPESKQHRSLLASLHLLFSSSAFTNIPSMFSHTLKELQVASSFLSVTIHLHLLFPLAASTVIQSPDVNFQACCCSSYNSTKYLIFNYCYKYDNIITIQFM